jgi:hypothetical protein
MLLNDQITDQTTRRQDNESIINRQQSKLAHTNPYSQNQKDARNDGTNVPRNLKPSAKPSP